MANGQLRAGVEVMQTATQGSKPRYFLNGKEISEQDAFSSGAGSAEKNLGRGLQGLSGGKKMNEGVPPWIDPAEWEAFLKSRTPNSKGSLPYDRLPSPAMMGSGQVGIPPMLSAATQPLKIGGDSVPAMFQGSPPFHMGRMPPSVPPGPGGGFAMPPRLSPKEMEAAVASDRERYLASIGRGPATPGPQISPAIQPEPAVQVKPGIRREPPQKDPASYDVKPAKEPPQRMPPQVEPPVSTRERKKKSRIKPTGVRQNA